jgi:hypothetical protein
LARQQTVREVKVGLFRYYSLPKTPDKLEISNRAPLQNVRKQHLNMKNIEYLTSILKEYESFYCAYFSYFSKLFEFLLCACIHIHGGSTRAFIMFYCCK